VLFRDHGAPGTTNLIRRALTQVVRRNLNIQPTITLRPGFPVRVIVNGTSCWRHIEAEID